MDNQIITKINNIGKVSSVFLIISKILLIIAFVVMIVSGIAMFFVPDGFITANIEGSAQINVDTSDLPFVVSDIFDDIDTDVEDIDVDFASVKLDIGKIESKNDSLIIDMSGSVSEVDSRDISIAVGFAMLFFSIYIAIVFVIMHFAHRFSNSIANCQSPFEENVVKKMKHFAFSMIPWAVISCFNTSFMNTASGASKIGININVTSILIVAMIIVLVYIFDFGAQLQREADETL